MSTSTLGSTSSSSSLAALIPASSSSSQPADTSGGQTIASLLLSPTGLAGYEKSLLKQSTPLKLQTELEANKFVSKSKKLGQILKLASVRGAKVSPNNKYIFCLPIILSNSQNSSFEYFLREKHFALGNVNYVLLK